MLGMQAVDLQTLLNDEKMGIEVDKLAPNQKPSNWYRAWVPIRQPGFTGDTVPTPRVFSLVCTADPSELQSSSKPPH